MTSSELSIASCAFKNMRQHNWAYLTSFSCSNKYEKGIEFFYPFLMLTKQMKKDFKFSFVSLILAKQ